VRSNDGGTGREGTLEIRLVIVLTVTFSFCPLVAHISKPAYTLVCRKVRDGFYENLLPHHLLYAERLGNYASEPTMLEYLTIVKEHPYDLMKSKRMGTNTL
jgi:hypothetical protein